MYLHFTPLPVQWLFSRYTWRKKVYGEKKIFLTFDDGPVPEVTPFVLDVLKEYNAKATFFCVGDNVRKYPDILTNVVREGHSLGNHTYHHLNGRNTATGKYLENVQNCGKEIRRLTGRTPDLFRPPYGRIRKEQSKMLLKEYEIIMWDVLSGDFDPALSPESCLKKSIRYTGKGSVVVFHDNPKAYHNLSYVLPRYLEYFRARGFTFPSL